MILCPYCEQGDVAPAYLKSRPDIIFNYCSECDTVWVYPIAVSNADGVIFEDFMKGINLIPDWQEIVYM